VKVRAGAAALVLGGAAIILIAVQFISCGGGSGNGGPTPIPIATDPSGTPVQFETFRDELADRLDAIGPNIGSVPTDVQEQLLTQCSQLANFADNDDVAPLCNGIRQAITNSDPGLIDNVVRLMRELEGD
jgi:hypothetical protein